MNAIIFRVYEMGEKLYSEECRALMDFIKTNHLNVSKDVKKINDEISKLNNSVIKKDLCDAYRQTLGNQIVGITDDLKGLNNRVWGILAGIIITILLTIVNLTC